jgi:diacylglycerol O-acyltransferase
VLLGLVDTPDDIEFPIEGIEPVAEDADTDADTDTGAGADRGADADGGDGDDSDDSDGGDGDGGGDTPGREDGGDTGLIDRVRSAAGVVGTAARAVAVAYDLLTRPDEPDTSLRGELGTAKRAAWTDPIDLDRVKAVGDAHDATVNDVILAATAGAFRRVLQEHGEDVADLELRSSVPVNLKPMSERTEALGNYFGLIFLPIPVWTASFDERIEIIHDRMDRERATIEAVLVYLLFQFVGRAPGPVQDWVLEQFEGSATGVVTNVPGPSTTLEFAGREVTDALFWAPEANDQGLSLSIISYDGSVRVGVAGDARLLPEPSKLSDALEAELDEQFGALE